ncbi:type I polyketide synthase, partial [Mycolicibacterium sp. CBMA 361]|uniref:beta-ketoacyl synthase N-terminal-like domain-containing protein n=1 Tax=Mycolicibacterium sp. CBMA 361 TaxID=2606610 RepID=UPI0012DE1B85
YTVDSACSSSLLAIHNACRSLHEGESDGALAGGVSIMLEPYTVDSACSSSLLAIHNACRSLHEGESDGALAGGVSIMLEPRKMSSGSAQGMLSPTGHCHAFDVAADGFVSAEASVMFMMKRLDDAQRDGDRILAVIRGTASNQDGHTVNIATPGADAQVAVYKRALDVGGVDPATVGYIEAHGTGTPVGDPIEYSSLATVYGIDGPVVLGSAKSNFGHAQSASGAVGLMKAVLSLQHGEVPKNLHFNEMPAEMAAIKTGLFVPTELVPWPATADHPRRAAVSAYGLSGTNVHAVVEQAPAQSSPRTVESEGQALSGKLLFPVSSTSAEELRRTAGKLADWAAAKGDSLHLGDTAYTLARRRAHRPVRTAVLAEDPAGLVQALRDVADGDAPYQRSAGKGDLGAVWVFSGQGSQWAAMGAGLLATEPVFAATIAEIEPLIAAESG